MSFRGGSMYPPLEETPEGAALTAQRDRALAERDAAYDALRSLGEAYRALQRLVIAVVPPTGR